MERLDSVMLARRGARSKGWWTGLEMEALAHSGLGIGRGRVFGWRGTTPGRGGAA